MQTLALSDTDLDDAYLAALAQWHHLTLVTADTGFSRFSALKVLNPTSPRQPQPMLQTGARRKR
ncbi:hypothetical protein [Deinococcus sp.]|uniref:hypothetical protein n=1 Tax=Deinococcus sp. TaxID=47478 RepID=UPI003CC620FA